MREAPQALLTVSTDVGERFERRYNFRLGLSARQVSFADHRAGWAAIRLDIDLVCWQWSFNLVRWRLPAHWPTEHIMTLRQQLDAEHGDRWSAYDARMAARRLP